MNKIQKIVSGLFLAIAMGSAHAATMNFEMTGDVDYWADAGNEFGLDLNHTISVIGSFDDSVLVGGLGAIDFSAGSGNTFTLEVGSQIFFESDDNNFDFGFPLLTIDVNSAFSSFAFVTDQPNGMFFDSYFDVFDAQDQYGAQINGTWNFDSLAVTPALTPVPVPAAFWLFGTGLIGLAGFAKRKQHA